MRRYGKRINLVICQKSKVQDWVEHFRKHYEKMDAWDMTKKPEYEGFFRTVEELDWITTVGVINYELAWRRPELLELKDFTLMLDESSMISNEKAKRTKFILKLQPAHVILLSGTPTAGKYERLWSQCHLLGWPISKTLYWQQYIITEKIEVSTNTGIRLIDVVVGYKNVDRLKSKLKKYGAVFLKTEEAVKWYDQLEESKMKDIMRLPEQTDITINVPVTPQYKTFMKKRVVKVGIHQIVGDTRLTYRLGLRQLCGQFNESKLHAFEDLMESTEDRLIVFYNFNMERELLQMICEQANRPVSIVCGENKDLTAYETRSDSVTLIQYQAGAMGLNLQKSNKVVYFTLPERSELFEQSKKRIHRIGQSKPCFYYYLMCTGSIEQSVLRTLRMRKDYTDELFRKNFGE